MLVGSLVVRIGGRRGGRGALAGLAAVAIGCAAAPDALALAPPADPRVTWTKLAVTPPTNRPYVVVNYAAVHNRLIAFVPGNGDGAVNEVWVLGNANGIGGAPAWTMLATAGVPPGVNRYASVTYIAASNKLLVYGGCQVNCSPARSGAFVLTNASGTDAGAPTWSQLTVTNPQARVAHSAIYDAARDELIRFGGGLAFYGTDQNDTATLSNASGAATPSTWTVAPAGSPPAPRESAAAFYDPLLDRMTLFGGRQLVQACCPNFETEYNDVFVLARAGSESVRQWSPMAPGGTPPRARSSMAYARDGSTDRAYVLGGFTFEEDNQSPLYFGDMFVLTDAGGVGTPTWLLLTQLGDVPPPMADGSAAFDASSQRIILMSGNAVQTGSVWVGQISDGPLPVAGPGPVAPGPVAPGPAVAPPPPAPPPPAPPVPCVDCDGDAYLAIVDCDDANPTIHPGAREIPGNKLDDDCRDGDADYPTLPSVIRTTWDRKPFRIKSLRVTRVLAGSRITVRCSGRGCPRKPRVELVPKRRDGISVLGTLRRARLKSGATVEVRVTKVGYNGVLRRVVVRRSGRDPRLVDLCLPARGGRPYGC